MKRIALVFALPVVVGLLMCGSAFGATNIVGMSGDDLDSSFDPDSGLLAIVDGCDVVVEYNPSPTVTYVGGSFYLSAYLVSDDSTPAGQAIGTFGSGAIVVKNSSAQDLLTAVLLSLTLTEGTDHNLGGGGQFLVTGGLLAYDIAAIGDIVDLTFDLDPSDIVDFKSAFEGRSNVTLLGDVEGDPIPEPLTMLGMLMGICGVGGYVRRKCA